MDFGAEVALIRVGLVLIRRAVSSFLNGRWRPKSNEAIAFWLHIKSYISQIEVIFTSVRRHFYLCELFNLPKPPSHVFHMTLTRFYFRDSNSSASFSNSFLTDFMLCLSASSELVTGKFVQNEIARRTLVYANPLTDLQHKYFLKI